MNSLWILIGVAGILFLLMVGIYGTLYGLQVFPTPQATPQASTENGVPTSEDAGTSAVSRSLTLSRRPCSHLVPTEKSFLASDRSEYQPTRLVGSGLGQFYALPRLDPHANAPSQPSPVVPFSWSGGQFRTRTQWSGGAYGADLSADGKWLAWFDSGSLWVSPTSDLKTTHTVRPTDPQRVPLRVRFDPFNSRLIYWSYEQVDTEQAAVDHVMEIIINLTPQTSDLTWNPARDKISIKTISTSQVLDFGLYFVVGPERMMIWSQTELVLLGRSSTPDASWGDLQSPITHNIAPGSIVRDIALSPNGRLVAVAVGNDIQWWLFSDTNRQYEPYSPIQRPAISSGAQCTSLVFLDNVNLVSAWSQNDPGYMVLFLNLLQGTKTFVHEISGRYVDIAICPQIGYAHVPADRVPAQFKKQTRGEDPTFKNTEDYNHMTLALMLLSTTSAQLLGLEGFCQHSLDDQLYGCDQQESCWYFCDRETQEDPIIYVLDDPSYQASNPCPSGKLKGPFTLDGCAGNRGALSGPCGPVNCRNPSSYQQKGCLAGGLPQNPTEFVRGGTIEGGTLPALVLNPIPVV